MLYFTMKREVVKINLPNPLCVGMTIFQIDTENYCESSLRLLQHNYADGLYLVLHVLII